MNGLAKVIFTIDGDKFYERRFKKPSGNTRWRAIRKAEYHAR